MENVSNFIDKKASHTPEHYLRISDQNVVVDDKLFETFGIEFNLEIVEESRLYTFCLNDSFFDSRLLFFFVK